VGTSPSIGNFGSKWPRWSEIADFRSIFARSAAAVTSTENSSNISNRKSTTRFSISPRWTSYVVPKSPKGGSKTQSVLHLWSWCTHQVIELFYFAMVCVVFLFAYGVAVQSLLYPNSEESGSHILYRIFYYPYLSMFQDFETHIGELEGTQLVINIVNASRENWKVKSFDSVGYADKPKCLQYFLPWIYYEHISELHGVTANSCCFIDSFTTSFSCHEKKFADETISGDDQGNKDAPREIGSGRGAVDQNKRY